MRFESTIPDYRSKPTCTVWSYAFSDARKFEDEINWNNHVFDTTHMIFLCAKESALRRKWRKNTPGREHRRRGGHAVPDQIPVYWECGFQLTYLVDRMYAPFRLWRSWTGPGLSGTLLRKSGSVCWGRKCYFLNELAGFCSNQVTNQPT